jgi:drug/metabolite transporter (DMT)-like permease
MTADGAGRPGPRLWLGVGAAFLALLCWAFPGVLGRGLDLPPFALVAYRIWIGVVLAVIGLRVSGGTLSWRLLRISAVAGVCFGVDLLSFFTAIKLTTVANATVIGSLQPVLLVFAAPLLFGERVRALDMAAAAVAIGGVVLVVWGSQGLPSWNLSGDLWAVVTLVSWTGYFIACKRAREHLSSTELTAGASVVALLVVTPAALAGASPLPWPTPVQWGGLAAIAVLGWSGHLLMNWALGQIPLWISGTTSLASPAVTTLFAALLLAEPVVASQWLGMAVVFVALTAATLRAPQVAELGSPVEPLPPVVAPGDEKPAA